MPVIMTRYEYELSDKQNRIIKHWYDYGDPMKDVLEEIPYWEMTEDQKCILRMLKQLKKSKEKS